MSSSKICAGLIYGKHTHHLDHLAPLCLLMDMPLIVTEEEIEKSAKMHYPYIQIIRVDYLHIAEYLVMHFDVIFYSIPRDLFDEIFFFAQKLLQKKIHTVWCPHGNSDKGNAIFFMEALRKEEIALVYGKQMIDFLTRKGAFNQLKAHVIMGNYRYALYLKDKDFYDQCVEKEIARRLPKVKQTFLYAPTWQDYEQSSSFFDALPHLVKKLPPDTNLLIKLHPNLLEQHDFSVGKIIDKYQSQDHLLFITDFPLVYPILNIADIYIGDLSSIGYDFLSFDRPMFFLNQNDRNVKEDLGFYLFRCGIEIKKENYPKIYEIIDRFFHFELRSFSQIRHEVYSYAFGHSKSLDILKEEIEKALNIFPEKGLSFFLTCVKCLF